MLILNALFWRPLIFHSRYIISIPRGWDSVHGPRPLVLLHGLGLGLLQYHKFFRLVNKEFKDRPILIVLQPHISQEIFHPRFLQPLSRRETSKRLAGLIYALGWAKYLERDGSESEGEKMERKTGKMGGHGITLLSHSKLVFILPSDVLSRLSWF